MGMGLLLALQRCGLSSAVSQEAARHGGRMACLELSAPFRKLNPVSSPCCGVNTHIAFCKVANASSCHRGGGRVGRPSAQASLRAFLDAVTEAPAALVFEGEAGIGKTTLLNDATK